MVLGAEWSFYIDIILATLSRFEADVVDLWDFTSIYGLSGVAIVCFGSGNTWRLEAQILGRLSDEEAMEFRKSVENECTMVSIAAAIVAQITVTTLSLAGLSQAHWTARGLLVLALVASLMAVYYATTLQRTIGQLLTAPHLRQWIRGGPFLRVGQSITRAPRPGVLTALRYRYRTTVSIVPFIMLYPSVSVGSRKFFADPMDLELERLYADSSQIAAHPAQEIVSRYCFTPSITSVLTIAAPKVLLATSLLTLLTGLGTYLGFTWTRDLDSGASSSDSRNVFTMYVVGLGACFGIYYLPQLLQDPESYSPRRALDEYCLGYFKSAPGEAVLQKWNLRLVDGESGLRLEQVATGDSQTIAMASTPNQGLEE